MTWFYISRNAKKTRCIIPGWTLLPSYFCMLYPNDNLYILNLYLDIQNIDEYLNTELKHFKVEIVSERKKNVESTILFSMGLQWAKVYDSELLDGVCELWSCSQSYDIDIIQNMTRQLFVKFESTLKNFYYTCCSKKQHWKWWRQHQLQSHLHYNSKLNVIHWLNKLSKVDVCPEEVPNGLWYLDQNDRIGIKPRLKDIHWHNRGHLIMPEI